MYQITIHTTATNAPIPADFAVFGFESFQTKNKINPTIGMQHPSNPHPNPPLSTTSDSTRFCCTPQCGQTTALSSISLPQTQTQVAEHLGTSQTMYARYERGANELPIHHLVSLCKLYHVSSDFLLGLSNHKDPIGYK